MKIWKRAIAKVVLFAAMASLLALALAACGGGGDNGGGGGGEGVIEVTETEFKIEPANITAPAGEITFEIKNNGSVEHDLAVVVNGETMTSPLVPPGQTVTWSVTIDQPGEYQTLCTVPGHKEAGMVGTLTVQ